MDFKTAFSAAEPPKQLVVNFESARESRYSGLGCLSGLAALFIVAICFDKKHPASADVQLIGMCVSAVLLIAMVVFVWVRSRYDDRHLFDFEKGEIWVVHGNDDQRLRHLLSFADLSCLATQRVQRDKQSTISKLVLITKASQQIDLEGTGDEFEANLKLGVGIAEAFGVPFEHTDTNQAMRVRRGKPVYGWTTGDKVFALAVALPVASIFLWYFNQ